MDISDLEIAIVAALGAKLVGPDFRPGGVSASNSIDGWPMLKIHRGWPSPTMLDDDLKNGVNTVTVFPVAGMSRLQPTRQRTWYQTSIATPTVTISIAGNVVTIGGVTGLGQVCGVAVGSSLKNMIGYAHRVTAGDSLSTVAAGLAAIIPGASVNGTAITIPSAPVMQVGAVADQKSFQELRHQTQDFLLTVWSPFVPDRDKISSAVDVAMMEIDRIVSLDGISTGPIIYRSSRTIDDHETIELWRRDLTFTIDYPTTTSMTQPSVLFPWYTVSVLSGGQSNSILSIGPQYPA